VQVQRFYEGVDTGDIALMNAKVADNYQVRPTIKQVCWEISVYL
jgi:hypothetical protein